MQQKLIEQLIQRYLAGKTSRDEERVLLDHMLKVVNEVYIIIEHLRR